DRQMNPSPATAPTTAHPSKPSARRLLVEVNRETKLAVFDGRNFDGRNFVLRPTPEHDWEFKIDANNCTTPDQLAGWVQYLLGMSWAHPVLVRQFARVVKATFDVDLADAAARGGDY
ncbi:UNVERIFIED_CONTAM: hypothetical protein RF648_20775, partial [Kocuria sp. CPCC 205274]